MCDSGISKSQKIAAGIMGIMMLVVMLFSAFYIAAEAEHDCTGDDCSICACIQQCENILHRFGDGAVVQISVAAAAIFILLSALFSAHILTQETPVSRKVRLNN